MNLHRNAELLKDAILATSQMYGIREIYVEKDYWVTVALYEIFHSDMADQVVFKGGTALSKCHRLIARFSEDVDLVVLRETGENDNQLKKKIRAISKIVESTIPEIEIEGLTNKMGNIRKTVHQYPKLYPGDFGPIREHVVLEATWRGDSEPFSFLPVSCYITEMMEKTGRNELITKYKMSPFTVKVLSKERTLCEKIMSLVRFSRTDDPISNLRNKIRHVYDIHLMLGNEDIGSFFNSDDFEAMLVRVGKDDLVSYKNNHDWLYKHPATAMIYAQPDETWEKIRSAYNTTFKELVTGALPAEAELIKTLHSVEARLTKADWNIE